MDDDSSPVRYAISSLLPILCSQSTDFQMSNRLPLPVRRNSDIYYRHLAMKGRGSPMWITEPSTTLPKAYRRRGIAVGDVGILTAFGAFDFMFNIFLPADHPINQQGLPEGFSPHSPQPQSSDIHRHMEFQPDSYLATASVEKSRRENGSSYGYPPSL